jgi:hypothetical protein
MQRYSPLVQSDLAGDVDVGIQMFLNAFCERMRDTVKVRGECVEVLSSPTQFFLNGNVLFTTRQE